MAPSACQGAGHPVDGVQRTAEVEGTVIEVRLACKSLVVRTECSTDACPLPERHGLQQRRQCPRMRRLAAEPGFEDRLARPRHRQHACLGGAGRDAHPDRLLHRRLPADPLAVPPWRTQWSAAKRSSTRRPPGEPCALHIRLDACDGGAGSREQACVGEHVPSANSALLTRGERHGAVDPGKHDCSTDVPGRTGCTGRTAGRIRPPRTAQLAVIPSSPRRPTTGTGQSTAKRAMPIASARESTVFGQGLGVRDRAPLYRRCRPRSSRAALRLRNFAPGQLKFPRFSRPVDTGDDPRA